jgi:hypothetical protein
MARQLPSRLLRDTEAAARRALGDEAFGAALARGAALGPDEAVPAGAGPPRQVAEQAGAVAPAGGDQATRR